MPTMQELFEQMTQVLLEAYEKQRDFHATAFGQPNAQEIIQQANANGKKLEGWREDLLILAREMEESGLFAASNRQAINKPAQLKRSKSTTRKNRYTGRKPAAVELFGKRATVTTWREVLLFVLEELYQREPARVMGFEDNPNLNKKRLNFSRQKDKITRVPMYSEACELYVETNLSSESIMAMCHKMIGECGLSDRDFQVSLRHEGAR